MDLKLSPGGKKYLHNGKLQAQYSFQLPLFFFPTAFIKLDSGSFQNRENEKKVL